MSSKLAAVVAGVAAAGAVFALLWSGRSDTPDRTGASPFPGVDPAAVTELEIRTGGARVRIVRSGDAWRLAEPVDDAADPRQVAEAIAALSRIRLGDQPVAAERGAWPRYEVGDDEVLTAVVTINASPLPPLHLGPSGFARVGDDPRVYEIPEFRRSVLERDPTEWRDLAVLDLAGTEIDAIEVIDRAGRRARAERAPGAEDEEVRALPASAWVLSAGHEHADPFDPHVPANLVRYLLALRAEGVTSGIDERAADAPGVRIRLFADSEVRDLQLGGRVDGRTALTRAGGERVWLLSHPQAQKLAVGPRQWRHKRLVDLEPRDVVAIEVTHADRRLLATRRDRWRLEHPAGALLDARATEDYVRRLAPVAADAVAAPDAAIPDGAAELAFQLRGGTTVRVAVGERDDGTFIVSSSQRDDLLLLQRQRAERLIGDAFALIREPGG